MGRMCGDCNCVDYLRVKNPIRPLTKVRSTSCRGPIPFENWSSVNAF